MATPFTLSIEVAAPVEAVWARITDWPAHGRWIPLTTVRVTSDRPDGLGARFVGRTALGPFGFDDPMEIVEWQPPVSGRPGHCRVRKHGRVVLGWAAIDVTDQGNGRSSDGPSSGATSRLDWTEQVELAPVRVTFPFAPLTTAVGRFGARRALQAMARELAAEVAADD